MAGVDVEPLLVAVGVIVASAFLANLLFRLTRLPDIILLILLGVLLGPATHLVNVGLFHAFAPFLGTVALIVILFEGGLKIRWDELRGGVLQGALLALLVFMATTLLCAFVARTLLGLPTAQSLLLGMALGGAGVVIVIPLIRELGVSARAQTVVSIEAAVSDVLVVLGVVGLATAIHLKSTEPAAFASHLVTNFAIGILLGAAGGLAWTRALKAFTERSYEYVLTIGVLFLLYAGAEFLLGSGPLAVLVFGLVVGNSRKTRRLVDVPEPKAGRSRRTWEYAPVFSLELVSLHNEVIFFLRAFFFVTLGVVLDLGVFADPVAVGIGFLLALGVMAGRFWGARIALGGGRMAPWDRTAVTLMFPLGLAAAVVSLVPSTRFESPIPGTQDFGAYAAVAIVVTNIAAAVLVFFLSRPDVRDRLVPKPNPRPWTRKD